MTRDNQPVVVTSLRAEPHRRRSALGRAGRAAGRLCSSHRQAASTLTAAGQPPPMRPMRPVAGVGRL